MEKYTIPKKLFDDYINSIKAFDFAKSITDVDMMENYRVKCHKKIINNFNMWLQDLTDNACGYSVELPENLKTSSNSITDDNGKKYVEIESLTNSQD